MGLDKEKARRRAAKWRAANIELARARKNACHKADPQKQIEARRKWRKTNPELAKERSKNEGRRWKLKNKYKITLDEYTEFLRRQDHKCATCRGPNLSARDWRIDHCHKTGKVRGLLCNSCNLALGLIRDDPETLKRMVDYVRTPAP